MNRDALTKNIVPCTEKKDDSNQKVFLKKSL